MQRTDQKSLIRAVVRQVHPDLFTAHPFERSKNAESLKALNVYADALSKGQFPDPARLEFYVKTGEGSFAPITTFLPGTASLAPLFLAFGLISAEEAAQEAALHASETDNDGRDLFEWLSQVAAEAATAADQHDALRREVRVLRSDLEDRYGFASVDVGGEFALAGEAQRQQRDALAAFGAGMAALEAAPGELNLGTAFIGLTVRVYHPDAAPLVTVGFQDEEGTFNVRSEPMESSISETGTLTVVAHADAARVAVAVAGLDLSRAQLLAKVTSYWARRSRDLAGALKTLVGVENVWFDTRTEGAAQRFVLWVGTLMERREEVAAALAGRSFAFSVLVHADESGPLLDFIDSSSVLQVRTDCPPKHLLAFMSSEAGAEAHNTAALVADTRAEEAAALEAVRDALGAKHVVRVCSSYDQQRVLEAAARLVEAAPSIRASLDLSGVSLAIDDCYDVWDSGFVSIPFDFALADLKPQLLALLAPPAADASNGASRNGAAKVQASAIMAPRRMAPLRKQMLPSLRRGRLPLAARTAAVRLSAARFF